MGFASCFWGVGLCSCWGLGGGCLVTAAPNSGDLFSVRYPFVREVITRFDEEGYNEAETWNPGVRWEDAGPEDRGALADGEGWMRLLVVDVFKPGRFPTRVFYTRSFVDPDGREFGKGRLLIATLEKFRRIASTYRHPYGIGEPYAGPDAYRVRTSRALFDEAMALAAANRAAQPKEINP